MEPGRAERIDRALAGRSGQRAGPVEAPKSSKVGRLGFLQTPKSIEVGRTGGQDWSSLRAGSAQERPEVRRGDQNQRQVVSRSDKTREFVRTARSRSIVGAIFR